MSTEIVIILYVIFLITVFWLAKRNSNKLKEGREEALEKYGPGELASFTGKSWGTDFYCVNTNSHGRLLFSERTLPEKLEWKEGEPYGLVRYFNTNFIVHVPANKYSDMKALVSCYQYEQRREKQQLAIKQAKENRKLPIIEFVKKHTGQNIEHLYSSMELSKTQAVRHYATYKLTPPTAPTYTRGVVRGSLADNISTIANAQKKEDYERKLDKHNNLLNAALDCKNEFERKADEIEDIIIGIPKHQKYLEMHRIICEEYRSSMRQVGL